MTINYLSIRHVGTDASCGGVAFYLRGIPMGRPLAPSDAYTFDGDVPVQMAPEAETVDCLSCGKRVGLVTLDRLLRDPGVDPDTGKSDDEMALAEAGVAAVAVPASEPAPEVVATDDAEDDHVGS